MRKCLKSAATVQHCVFRTSVAVPGSIFRSYRCKAAGNHCPYAPFDAMLQEVCRGFAGLKFRDDYEDYICDVQDYQRFIDEVASYGYEVREGAVYSGCRKRTGHTFYDENGKCTGGAYMARSRFHVQLWRVV